MWRIVWDLAALKLVKMREKRIDSRPLTKAAASSAVDLDSTSQLDSERAVLARLLLDARGFGIAGLRSGE
jgi:hypothetical protein